MKGTEYTLILYEIDKRKKVIAKIKTTFVVNPRVRVRTAYEDDMQGTVKEIKLKKESKEAVVERIREWLFRKTAEPFVDEEQEMVWSVVPAFDKEDKEVIMHHYMFEEL